MPGTVKSGLLSDADKSYKCDSQEKVCWILNLPLDKGHFITELSDVDKLDEKNFQKIVQEKLPNQDFEGIVITDELEKQLKNEI